MQILDKVDINGFWGEKDFTINFRSDVNFLIGTNGTGKTTVINLIAAALKGDFETLDRIPFSSVKLYLKKPAGKKLQVIELEKTPRKFSPFMRIKYSIIDNNKKPILFNLNQMQEELGYRDYPSSFDRNISTKRLSLDIIERLNSLANVSWLSIHRIDGRRDSREDRSYESTIDKKISHLSNEFVRYFSRLDKKGSEELSRFQATVFLSLLIDESQTDIVSSVKKLNLNNEKKSLTDIYKEFKIDDYEHIDRVEKHFNLLPNVLNKFGKDGGNISWNDIISLVSAWRTHSVVQDWTRVVDEKVVIYEPKTTFLKILNSMIPSKIFDINENNELAATLINGKPILLKMLSSGEKQLIIILGEALLQEKKPWIYIADEPELSLHLSWQEQIIHNLVKINPKAQIIFATHSPDIVSHYSENVIELNKVMNKCL